METSPVKSRCNDAIAPAMQPAVLGRLLRLNARDDDDLTATVLNLAQKGAICIEKGLRHDAAGKASPDYLITRADEAESLCGNRVEKATLSLLFDIAGEGQRSLWLGDLHSFARHRFDVFSKAVDAWQNTLSEEVARCGFTSRWNRRAKEAGALVATLALVGGALAFLQTRSPLILLFALAVAATAAIFAKFTPKLTERGTDAASHAKELACWLGALDERTVRDKSPDEWAALMPCAFVMGAASDTIDALRKYAPDMLAEGSAESAVDQEAPYKPWVLWYSESLANEDEGLPHAARAISQCITKASFAAKATEATSHLAALNSPVQGATSGGGLPGVGGVGGGPDRPSSTMR